jgi:subtilisin family serine protease
LSFATKSISIEQDLVGFLYTFLPGRTLLPPFFFMFDPKFYRANYPDLPREWNTEQLWEHYLNFGLLERRRPSGDFCFDSALFRYPDLREAFYGCHLAAYHHYLSHGIPEGRDYSPIPNAHQILTASLYSPASGFGAVSVKIALKRVGACQQDVSGRGIKVALIDSGIDLDHVALNPSLSVKEEEILDGRDNDLNGLIDDVHGYDFGEGDADPSDNLGHGTMVAGILAAKAFLFEGLIYKGIAPGSKILACKISTPSGGSNDLILSRAIDYAVDEGSHILNISQRLLAHSDRVLSSLQRARDRGVAIVMGAGNEGASQPCYPGIYAKDLDGLVVGGLDRDGWIAPWSNLAGSLPQNYVLAPGEVASTTIAGRYGRGVGTSFAAPYVAGLCALLLEARPDLTPAQLTEIVTSTSSNIVPPVFY